MTARESPVFAIQTSLSIMSITIAQLPDLSRTWFRFYFMNCSSASLKPFSSDFSGFYQDFLELNGFNVAGVDYDHPLDIERLQTKQP